MSTPPGLRELKKQMTHDTIAEVAFRLAVEKGLDHVTIDDIAQEAFVSPRTVSNYFAGKEEAVVTASFQGWFTIVDSYIQRPPDEPPLKALCEVTSDFARNLGKEQLAALVTMAELQEQFPALVPYQTEQYERLEGELRSAISERAGTSVETEMYPWLVASAAVSAIKSALRLWVRSSAQHGHLPELLEIAFNELSDGLPVPSSASATAAATMSRQETAAV